MSRGPKHASLDHSSSVNLGVLLPQDVELTHRGRCPAAIYIQLCLFENSNMQDLHRGEGAGTKRSLRHKV